MLGKNKRNERWWKNEVEIEAKSWSRVSFTSERMRVRWSFMVSMESNREWAYLKPLDATFTSFMLENENRKKKKTPRKRKALLSLRPSSPSLFNSLLYISMLGWREGREGEMD